IDYNLYFNVSAVITGGGDGGSIDFSGAHSLKQVDPKFVDEAAMPLPDLHLAPGSPARETGTNVGLPFSGKGPNMGALQTLRPESGPLLIDQPTCGRAAKRIRCRRFIVVKPGQKKEPQMRVIRSVLVVAVATLGLASVNGCDASKEELDKTKASLATVTAER